MNQDLNQYILRARRYLRAVPVRVQGVALLLLAAVAVTAIIVFSRTDSATPVYQPLLSRLNDDERRDVELALAEAKLHDYEFRDGSLYVPAGSRSQYMAAISDSLPPTFPGLADDVIEGANMLDSTAQINQRIRRALEKRLCLILRRLPDVEVAYAQIDETPPRGLKGSREITAAVFVQAPAGRTLDMTTLRTIHDIVLNFKAGLQSEQISITDINANTSFSGTSLASPDSPVALAVARRNAERQLQERVSTALFVPHARIAVHVRHSASDTSSLRSDDVHVSVGIPASYLESVLNVRRRQATGPAQNLLTRSRIEEETRSQILTVVRPLLPGPPTESQMKDLVTFTFFDDPEHLAANKLAPSRLDHFSIPLGTFTLFMLCIVLGAIIWWQKMHRGDSQRAPQLRVVNGEKATVAEPRKPEDSKENDDLRDRLQTTVEGDPEAAARSLSAWIEKAG